MIKFTSQYSDGDPLVEVTLDSDSGLGEVIEYFNYFLKASGYSYDGIIDVIYADEQAQRLIDKLDENRENI